MDVPRIVEILRGEQVGGGGGDDDVQSKSKNSTLDLTLMTNPTKWTLDDIDQMADAAANNKSVTHLRLSRLGTLNILTVVPFIKLIENSSTLEDINIRLSTMGGRNKVQNLADMVFHAAIRNKSFSIKKFAFVPNGSYSFNNPQLLQRLLECSKIESLHIGCEYDSLSLSNESSWALAAGLRGLLTLKDTNINVRCDNEALNHIIVSLQSHPNLEKVEWKAKFDYGALCGMLTLCSSCPKIKNVEIFSSYCDETTGNPHNVGPLLYGLRFSESLESLSLVHMQVKGIGPICPLYSNESIHTLTLHTVEFQDSSLTLLRHFKGLKKLHFHCCKGVSAEIVDVLDDLKELEELQLLLDDEDEEENDSFLRNIHQIISHGPPSIFFRSNTTVTKLTIATITSGVQSRPKHLKRFGMKCDNWDRGALDQFCKDSLPFLTHVEELALYDSGILDIDEAEQQAEFRNLLESLPSLKKLKSLTLACFICDSDTAKSMLNFFKTNKVVEELEDVSFISGLEPLFCDKIDYYVQLNRYGRRFIGDHDVPLGLWPHILEKITSEKDKDYVTFNPMFEFVQSLNNTVNLFKKA